jgi:hypothetical protein
MQHLPIGRGDDEPVAGETQRPSLWGKRRRHDGKAISASTKKLEKRSSIQHSE